MNFYGLTLKDLIVAALIGLAIAGVFTYATAPRMVEVPVQVITPVPTPPPIVDKPQQAVRQAPLNPSQYCSEVENTMSMAIWIFGIFAVVIFVGCLFTSNGAGMMIQVIITLLVLGVLISIVPSITTAVCEAAPVMIP
jgi:hypothetical protein